MSVLVPGALALALASTAGGGLPTRLSLEVPPLRLAALQAPLGEPAPPPPVVPDAALAADVPPPSTEVGTPVRLLAETGGTVALGLSGSLLGAYVGARACPSEGTGPFSCLDDMVIGAGIGILVGAAGGATLGGHLADGDGNFLASLLGAAAGFAAGVALESPEVLMIGTAAGSIGGYELSHALAD